MSSKDPKFIKSKQQIKRKPFYKIPDCSDDGKRLNENGNSLYTKYKDLDKEENITCYAAEEDLSSYNNKINTIDSVIKYRHDFTKTCINPQHRDQGHHERIQLLQRERKNCEKKINQEGKRRIQNAHGQIIDAYIETNQEGNIGFVVDVNVVDHAHIIQLYKYLLRKTLIKDTGIRKLSKKIDMINDYFSEVKQKSKTGDSTWVMGDVNNKTKNTDSNSIIMIGDVPVVLKSNSPIAARTRGKMKARRSRKNTTKKNVQSKPGNI